MNRSARTFIALILVALAGLVVGLSACQRYEPRPLDLSSHAATFILRTPDSALEGRAMSPSASGSAGVGDFDVSDGLVLAEAEAVAMVFNADLRIARLRAGVAAASAANAGLWADPSIGVDLTRIVQNVAEPWKLASTVGITLPISGRLEAEKALAEADRHTELARVAEREWAVRMDLRRAWCEWSALQEQREVTARFVQRMDDLMKVIDLMERAGEMPRTEARLFRIESTSARGDLASLEAQAKLVRGRILRLMGLSPMADATLIPSSFGGHASLASLSSAIPDGDGGSPVLHEELMRRSPRLRVAGAEYESAERSLAHEIRGQYPDLHVGPGYGREDGNDQVLLGVSMPLPLWNANRRGIAEASAKRELARANAESTLEALIAEIDAAITRWRAAQTQLEILVNEVAPMVEAQDADARRLAELGEVNTLVLLESLTRRRTVALRLIDARREEAVAAIDIEELVGPDWAESKEPAAVPAADAAEPGRESRP